jgi:hypothetical protein
MIGLPGRRDIENPPVRSTIREGLIMFQGGRHEKGASSGLPWRQLGDERCAGPIRKSQTVFVKHRGFSPDKWGFGVEKRYHMNRSIRN